MAIESNDRLIEDNGEARLRGVPPRDRNNNYFLPGFFVLLAVIVLMIILTRDPPGINTLYGLRDCTESIETSKLFAYIRRSKYLYQDNALAQFEKALRSEKRYNGIAFVGTPGVGKTLLTQIMANDSVFQSNAHFYSWRTYVSDESEKMHSLRMMMNQFVDCGVGLLVVDNLMASDNGLIPNIQSMAYEIIGKNSHGELNLRLLVIFIFTVNVREGEIDFLDQHKMLQNLSDVTTIHFGSFELEELKECIRLEAEKANIVLSREEFREVVDETNVATAGCKNVRAKVLTVGTPRA